MYSNGCNECFPSIKKIASITHVSERTVNRAILELQKVNAISVTRRQKADGSWSSNLYHIHVVQPGEGALLSPPSDTDVALTRPVNYISEIHERPERGEAKRSPLQDHHEKRIEQVSDEVLKLMLDRLEKGILPHLADVERSSSERTIVQYVSRSPVRDDEHASFSIGVDRLSGRIVFYDHGAAGLMTQAQVAAKLCEHIGEPMSFLYPPASGEGVTTFTYYSASGEAMGRKVKRPPTKDFMCQKRTTEGWSYGKPRYVPLFNLPEVLAAAHEGKPIYIVEGEKDAVAACKAGVVSTSPPDGAGSWRPEFTDALRGARVIIVRDNDLAGRHHAEKVAKALFSVCNVKVMDPGIGKDLADHLGAGMSIQDLIEVIG
jgi:hypothetical protein